MTKNKAIEMIDEYLSEPNNINKEWVECLQMCKDALLMNESLVNAQETLQKTIVEKKEEIERLEEMFDSSVSSERNVVDNIGYEKAEAIKEFAERLKKEALKHKIFPLDSCVDFDDIDNLVKEMTERKE